MNVRLERWHEALESKGFKIRCVCVNCNFRKDVKRAETCFKIWCRWPGRNWRSYIQIGFGVHGGIWSSTWVGAHVRFIYLRQGPKQPKELLKNTSIRGCIDIPGDFKGCSVLLKLQFRKRGRNGCSAVQFGPQIVGSNHGSKSRYWSGQKTDTIWVLFAVIGLLRCEFFFF